VLRIKLVLFFIITLPKLTWAVRPFVTDDARIIDVRQLEVETWTEFQRSKHETTIGQHIMAGYTFNSWFELIAGSGVGHDHKNNEFAVANPVIQPKFLLWQAKENGIPGLALASGLTMRSGTGAYYEEAMGYYFMALATTRLFKDWLQIHLNLGKKYADVKNEQNVNKDYWGLGIDVGIYHIDYRIIAEAYAGDPFEALGPRVSYQAGFRWLKSDFINYDLTFGMQREVENRSHAGRNEYWVQIGIRLLFDNLRSDLGAGDPLGAKGLWSF